MVTGVWTIVSDLPGFVSNLEALATKLGTNPGELFEAILEEIKDKASTPNGQGALAFELVTTILTGGSVGSLKQGGKLAKLLEKAKKLGGKKLDVGDAPVNVLDDAAKAQGKVVGSFKIDLTNPPPQGWRYWTTPYSPKFANPRIVDPATGLKVPTSALGSKTGLHELQHFLDATQHPQLYYFARASNAPGAGLAHFVFETRGYLQSHGLQALFNPSLAMASVRHAGRAHLVYRDLAGLAGLGGLGGFVYWFTSNESGQQ
jgi:hypothetical protein